MLHWHRLLDIGRICPFLAFLFVSMVPLAASARDCDFYRPRTKIIIVAPASNVPQEFAQFSGKWRGIAESTVSNSEYCVILAIETIGAEGNVEGTFALNRLQPKKFRSQIIDGKITSGKFTFMLSAEMDGRITGQINSKRFTMEKFESL